MPKWKKNLFKSAFLPFFLCSVIIPVISSLSSPTSERAEWMSNHLPKQVKFPVPYTQLHSAIESFNTTFQMFQFCVCALLRRSSRHLTQMMKIEWMSTRKARSKSAWRKSTWPKDLCRWIKAKNERRGMKRQQKKSEEKSWTNWIARSRARKNVAKRSQQISSLNM